MQAAFNVFSSSDHRDRHHATGVRGPREVFVGLAANYEITASSEKKPHVMLMRHG